MFTEAGVARSVDKLVLTVFSVIMIGSGIVHLVENVAGGAQVFGCVFVCVACVATGFYGLCVV